MGLRYFGKVIPHSRTAKDAYEMFEFFLDSYKNTPKERLLEFMKDAPDIDTLKQMEQMEIALEYCERCVAAITPRNPE
jgi:hypothetical protein